MHRKKKYLLQTTLKSTFANSKKISNLFSQSLFKRLYNKKIVSLISTKIIRVDQIQFQIEAAKVLKILWEISSSKKNSMILCKNKDKSLIETLTDNGCIRRNALN
jgi:hypothetical protein